MTLLERARQPLEERLRALYVSLNQRLDEAGIKARVSAPRRSVESGGPGTAGATALQDAASAQATPLGRMQQALLARMPTAQPASAGGATPIRGWQPPSSASRPGSKPRGPAGCSRCRHAWPARADATAARAKGLRARSGGAALRHHRAGCRSAACDSPGAGETAHAAAKTGAAQRPPVRGPDSMALALLDRLAGSATTCRQPSPETTPG